MLIGFGSGPVDHLSRQPQKGEQRSAWGQLQLSKGTSTKVKVQYYNTYKRDRDSLTFIKLRGEFILQNVT